MRRIPLLPLIIAVFLISLVGSLPLLSRYHFDEGWYTNAAIEMDRTGEYLTPRYADGTVRFKKPIVAYWVLAVSYATFGVGLVSSRFPFLLAGAAVLWVTYRLARSMTEDSATAALAAALLGSNIQFMESATKSTPDMLQCLFLTLATWGAAEVLFRERAESRWVALLYVGAGLAAATKGLLAFALVGFVLLFARSGMLPGRRPAQLVRWPWAMLGLVLAGGWLVTALLREGTDAPTALFEDQIGERLDGASSFAPSNLALYLLTPLRFFAPWVLLLGAAVIAQRGLLVDYVPRRRAMVWFVLGWFLVNLAIFSLGNLMRSRYLLPTYPLLAILLADLLMHAVREPTANRLITRLVGWVLAGGIGLGLVVAAIGSRLSLNVVLGGLVFAGFLAALFVGTFRRPLVPALVALSLAVMAAFGVLEQAIKPDLLASPAPEITQRLLGLEPAPPTIAVVGLRPSVANQIRLLSEGRLIVRELPRDVNQDTLTAFPVILSAESAEASPAVLSSYSKERCGAAFGPPTAAQLWEWLRTGEKPASATTARTVYYLFRRLPPDQFN